MPLTIEQVEKLEKVSGQMDGLHKEITTLLKKSPNDGLNKFKLKFVNAILTEANEVLGETHKPLAEFEQFDPDDLPTTSDVALILGQYIEELERKRADNIRREQVGYWAYHIIGGTRVIRTSPPKKLQEKK
ncbi:hypothetical protein SRABI05_04320 [Agrobacterium fabrum]|uniref:hypothetical protein n=1 Tax=Agrobacterium fabrum TaxID=1176649 RepID=UPI001D847F8D|nr:hypothetical protein [Agrobacterium fabrum]CAH0289836.1 hypothetical protein SRABI46_04291 [Agrobacterium fabrum]CAH0298506.1 hypothetical protein SRABI05_04320 [Agrobacterium fabrum]